MKKLFFWRKEKKKKEIVNEIADKVVNISDISNISDEEWENLYKTNYDVFWDLTVKEYDPSKLPDEIGSLRDGSMLYGEDAKEAYLYRLRSVVEYNEWTISNRPEVIDNNWNILKKLKKELQERNPSEKVYMLDVIISYEIKYIQY